MSEVLSNYIESPKNAILYRNYYETYISSDKDIIIDFIPLFSRFTFNTDYNYFKIIFKNNLNVVLKEVILSNSNIIELLENLNYSISYNADSSKSFLNNSFGLYLFNIEYINDINSQYYKFKLIETNLELLESNNESFMKEIFHFNLYNNDIIDLYNLFSNLISDDN